MHTLAGERIEKHRQGSHEGLALSGGHLRNLSLMQYDTADELHIIVYHLPDSLIASGNPMVLPEGLVTLDGHEIVGHAEMTVKF